MSKFLKLAQLNQDIELLENAGKIKAADILHKKFIREAQTYNFPDDSPKLTDSNQLQITNSQPRPYNALLNEINMNDDNSVFNELYQEYINNKSKYPKDEQDYLSKGINRILKFRRSQGIPLPAGATIIETRAPGAAAKTTATGGPQSRVEPTTGLTVTTPGGPPAPTITPTVPAAPAMGVVAGEPRTQYTFENSGGLYNPQGYRDTAAAGQGVIAVDPNTEYTFENSGGLYKPTTQAPADSTTQTPEAPAAQAPEAPAAQAPTPPSPTAPKPPAFVEPAGPNSKREEKNENILYSERMREIVALLENTYSFDQADKVYLNTIKFFKNPKRWERFYAQYNKLRYDKYNEWLRYNTK